MGKITKYRVVSTIIVCAFVAVTGAGIFWNLGDHPLQRWDEQGNVHVVQTTMLSGNWLILKCKDKCSDCRPRDEPVPFLDKPPLWYWLTMCSVLLFGENNTAYRLVSAIAAFVLTLFVFWLGSTWFGFPAGIGAIVSILTARHMFMTGTTLTTHSFRTADLDSLHLLFIMIGIYFFQRAVCTANSARTVQTDTVPLALALLASCLAYFTKGPMGFLPLIIFILYLAVHAASALIHDIITQGRLAHDAPDVVNNIVRELSKTLLLLLITAAVVIVPWYAYQFAHIGRPFIDDHILYHLVRRVREPLEGHHGTWRFYVNIFFNLKIFLMGVPACAGLLAVAAGAGGRLKVTDDIPSAGLKWWLDFRFFSVAAGFVISFTVISAVQTKLIWYIFYVYPFAALLVGILTGISSARFRFRIGT